MKIKSIAAKFNRMVGQSLDVATISKYHTGPISVVEPGEQMVADTVRDDKRLNVYIDECNVVNGFRYG